ncbi:MAG: DnaJ C-terminal domain-containing protein, partial [Alphaproteobacteria bacterium]
PAGVEDGTRIRLSGEGEMGQRGGPSGDLYIFLTIKDHDLFERDAQHLFISMPVSMTTAALGGELEVPSLDGARIKVKIPSGAQSGQQLRLRGKGMSIYRRQDRGDLYVRVEVETPTNLNKRQRELLAEFEKEGSSHSPLASKFLNKVKGFFTAE